MGREVVTRWTCDRCKATRENNGYFDGWTEFIQTAKHAETRPGDLTPRTMCGECVQSFHRWFLNTGRVQAGQGGSGGAGSCAVSGEPQTHLRSQDSPAAPPASPARESEYVPGDEFAALRKATDERDAARRLNLSLNAKLKAQDEVLDRLAKNYDWTNLNTINMLCLLRETGRLLPGKEAR